MKRAGLAVQTEVPPTWRESDVLVVWNRYGSWHAHACAAEKAGATVLVAENGYLGREWNGSTWYALSRNWHNGRGTWDPSGPERWTFIGGERYLERIKDRPDDRPILLLPQRGFGPAECAMPEKWVAQISRQYPGCIVRAHPGNAPESVPLRRDLERCGVAITHGSGAGIKAMAMGYAVLSTWPDWIGYPAQGPILRDGKRQEMFERLAWAMWSVEEVSTGAPIARLI